MMAVLLAFVSPCFWVDSIHSGSLDEPGEKPAGIWALEKIYSNTLGVFHVGL